jgi:8-oxo-dGTP pyrophosphatase MutT (NUDIX family)
VPGWKPAATLTADGTPGPGPPAPHLILRGHPLLAALADDLRTHPGQPAPDEGSPARAAVAIVLRTATVGETAVDTTPSTPSLELLLIQRAVRHGDPWSGQVALPGGRWDPGDATLQDTAIRETLEETGLDLARHGHVLGMLDELRPRTPVLPPIIVTPFVVVTGSVPELLLSDEVAAAFWAPWSLFADPAAVSESTVRVRGAEWRVASYQVGERVVWGMTERMLRQLAERLHRLAR